MAAEPKSGKLFKLSPGLFGAKWSEKWAHWDGRVLKCFPIASAQQSSFSWSSSRHINCVLDLSDFTFAPANEGAKPETFACVSDTDLVEWKAALTSVARPDSPEKEASSMYTRSPQSRLLCTRIVSKRTLRSAGISAPSVAEKVRRAAEAFTSPRGSPYIYDPVAWIRHAGWQGEEAELALIQQQLDPTQQGKISRDRLLRWLSNYYNAQCVMDRVQSEKTALLKRDTGADADPSSARTASPDESVTSNQLHPPKAYPAQKSGLPSSTESRIDWDAQYRRLLSASSTTDPFVRGLHAAALVNRFRETAELTTRKIIEELALPDAAKTIPPLSTEDRDEILATDGLAAFPWIQDYLVRYHHDSMLIYMVTGQKQSPAVATSRIESTCPCDDTQIQLEFNRIMNYQIGAANALHYAIEEAQREKASEAVGEAPASETFRLCVPLQCCVNYLGFRCFVVASNTAHMEACRLRSSPGHARVLKEPVARGLQLAFERLGLIYDRPIHHPEHTETIKGFTLPPFIPSHAGCSIKLDGETPVVMLHNLACLFPAVVLDGDDTVCRFRREFVSQHGPFLPLQALQATDNPSSIDSDSVREPELLQLALRSASEHLMEMVIPGFMADLEASPLKLEHSHDLSNALHASGINVKFLGRCYTLATRDDTRRLLLSEMLARAAKVELAISLRAIVLESAASPDCFDLSTTRDSVDEDGDNSNNSVDASQASAVTDARQALVCRSAVRVVVEFLNLLFGADSHPNSKSFWQGRILPRVLEKFSLQEDHPALAFESIMSGDAIYLPQLVHAVQAQTRVALCDHMEYNFRSPSPVSEEDVERIESACKASVTITAECEAILTAKDELVACDQLEAALDSVKLRLSVLETDKGGGCFCQVTLSHYLTRAAELSLRLSRDQDAREYASFAVEVAPKNHAIAAHALTVAMTLDGLSHDLPSAERHFTDALSAAMWHLGPCSSALIEIFMTMVDVYTDAGELARAEAVLADCAELSRQTHGSWSLTYAHVRRRQAMLMHERWQATASPTVDEVFAVLEDAIAIYERHLSSPITVRDAVQLKLLTASCYHVAAEIAAVDQDAYNMAAKALAMRKASLPSCHEDVLASNLQLAAATARVGDSPRAIESYRQALATLKQGASGGLGVDTTEEQNDWAENVDRIRDVSREMLQLFLGSLSDDQQDVVRSIKQRHAALLDRLKHPTYPDGTDRPETDVMSVVVRTLFLQDPVEYASWLIGAVARDLLASPRSPLSHSLRFGTRHPDTTSDDRADLPALRTPSGDVTLSAQLAAVLFLAEPSDCNDATD